MQRAQAEMFGADQQPECTRCMKGKPLSRFRHRPTKSGGQYRERVCKDCHSAAARKWQEDNPDRVRAYARERYRSIKSSEAWQDKLVEQNARRYGLSPDDYHRMLEAHKGLCAVCRKPETAKSRDGGVTRRLCIDHEHGTGRVRGLLCVACNHFLGLVDKHGVGILDSMRDYFSSGMDWRPR